MTDTNKTLIAGLMDRSGSMASIKHDTEGGWNSLLEEQKKLPGEVVCALAEFDTEFDVVFPIMPITAAGAYSLHPRGGTALLDAMGRWITEIGEKLAGMAEEERPGKVQFVILTDGEENSSREWTFDKVKELVTQQRDQWGWDFVFMGANIDAITVASHMGIAAGSSLTYDANSVGTSNAFAAANNYVTRSRGGQAADFTEEERASTVTTP